MASHAVLPGPPLNAAQFDPLSAKASDRGPSIVASQDGFLKNNLALLITAAANIPIPILDAKLEPEVVHIGMHRYRAIKRAHAREEQAAVAWLFAGTVLGGARAGEVLVVQSDSGHTVVPRDVDSHCERGADTHQGQRRDRNPCL